MCARALRCVFPALSKKLKVLSKKVKVARLQSQVGTKYPVHPKMLILLKNVLGIGIVWLYKGFWGPLSCQENCNKIVNKINKIVNKIGFKINKIATKWLTKSTKLLTKSPPKCNKIVNKIPPQMQQNCYQNCPLNQQFAQKSLQSSQECCPDGHISIWQRPQQPVPFLANISKKQGKNWQKWPKTLSNRNGPSELESFFFVFLGGKWVSGACSKEFPQFWAVSF